jgi:hypothetical protein
MAHLFLEHKSVLQLPCNFDQSASLWVVLCLVDFSNGFLQSVQSLLQLSVCLWIITHWCLATQVIEQQWVLAHSLDGL